MIAPYLLNHHQTIIALCEKHNVVSLYAFGSIVDGRFVEGKSDIDLLISFIGSDISPKQKANSLFVIWITMQNLLKCKVDLVTADNLEGKYFIKYLDLYKEPLYIKEDDDE